MPVPLHAKRLRWRGFNQAEEIGKLVAAYLNSEFCTSILVRTNNNQPQVKLNKDARLLNIVDCFGVKHAKQVFGKKIVLIDDVVTTGATLNECAKVLKAAGAKEVWALTVANG